MLILFLAQYETNNELADLIRVSTFRRLGLLKRLTLSLNKSDSPRINGHWKARIQKVSCMTR